MTLIFRHRRENLKKCSLRGLESRPDLQFLTYPPKTFPDLSSHILLHFEGPILSEEDRHAPLLLIDGTWKYSASMLKNIEQKVILQKRSLPAHFRTAYPRRQPDCPFPDRGLASVEALYIAYLLTKKDPTGLLDHYHFKDLFLEKNHSFL